jgi:hypothetical protein
LLQKALNGFTAKKSATAITAKNVIKDPNIQENLGRYDASLAAKTKKQPKIISTINLKAKALPVINGKKSEPLITKGTKGMAKSPANMMYLR